MMWARTKQLALIVLKPTISFWWTKDIEDYLVKNGLAIDKRWLRMDSLLSTQPLSSRLFQVRKPKKKIEKRWKTIRKPFSLTIPTSISIMMVMERTIAYIT